MKPTNGDIVKGSGHIPYTASLLSPNQVASAGPAIFEQRLGCWEAAEGTKPGEEDFMDGFGSSSDDDGFARVVNLTEAAIIALQNEYITT